MFLATLTVSVDYPVKLSHMIFKVSGIGTIFKVLPFLAVLFIFLGDILPSPLNSYSRNIRNGVNNFAIGLFPSSKVENHNNKLGDEFERQEKTLRNSQNK